MRSLLLENFQLIHNRYRVIKLISRGGEGYIYLVQDTLNNNQICIAKQMYFGIEDLDGIEKDYQLFGGLLHPNIVQILDFFWSDGLFFIIMNYVAGQTMRDFLRRESQPLDEIKVLNWGLKLAHILRFLHNRPNPIFHADIAPDNIIVTPNQELVLIDFGIARSSFEAVGLREGYSAPEQVNGILDPSCDVYSLGATLYKCLTLKEPEEPNLDALAVNSQVSSRTSSLIKKATAPTKSALFGLIKMRYADMDELIGAIQQSFVSGKV